MINIKKYCNKSKLSKFLNANKLSFGFTLVELIVVITILSILGTISFISFGGYSSQARDSSRVADLSNISKGLVLQYTISGKYPIPDNYITLTASGTPIGYQGKVGTNVKSIIKISEPSIDPLDKTSYTYSTNINQDKYQLLGFLEDGDNVNLSLNNGIENGRYKIENNGINNNVISNDREKSSLVLKHILNIPAGVYTEFVERTGMTNNFDIIEKTYALDYSNRHSLSKGDSIGILLSSGSLEPKENTNSGNYEIINSNTGDTIIAIDKTNTITSSGNTIYSTLYNLRNDLIKNKELAKLDDSLIGFWDMETLTGGLLKDWSRYENNGTCFNWTSSGTCGTPGFGPQFVDSNGTSGKGMSFDGIDDVIEINNNPLFDLNDMTLYAKIKHSGTGEATNGGGWRIISRQYGTPTATDLFYLRIDDSFKVNLSGLNNRGDFTVGTRASGSGQIYNYLNIVNIIDGNFHILANVKGANMKKFIDGNIKTNYLNSVGKMTSNSSKVYIGGMDNIYDLFSGIIDEVRIYNRALSDSEIQALYNSTK